MVKVKWQALQDGSISNRTDWMLMSLVLLLAFALGANGLNADIIWTDELFSVSNMGAFNPPYSPAQIIDSITEHSPDQVPLFYLLGAGWAQLAGWSQFALRLLSVFFGVLMVAWLYRFAADAVNRRTALVAALLLSTNAFVILYFHEIRMYTLFMLLAMMHSWFYWRLAHGFRVTRRTWLLFILTISMLLYTHNFTIILFADLGVYHLLFASRSRRWFNIITGWALGVLLFLPYIPQVLDGLSQARNNVLWREAASSLEVIEAFAYLLVNGLNLLWLPLILSFGYALWRLRSPAIVRVLSIALIMIAALLFVNYQFQLIPIARMRYFLVSWFVFIILFAYGLTFVPRWFIITALFTLLWSIAGYRLSDSTNILDYAGVRSDVRIFPPLHDYADNLRDEARYWDYLIGFSHEGYINRARKHGWSTADYYLKVQLGIDGIFLHTSLKRYRLERDVRGILREHPYVLLAHDPSDVSLNYVKTLEIIQENYILCAVLVNEPNLLVQRYVHPVLDCDHEPTPIEYGNDIDIKVVDYFARYAPESDLVQILTWWEVAMKGLLNEYNVSLQVITSDWRNTRQIDRHLYDDLLPWNVLELSTEGLPPGNYRLMLILYNRDSGEKVSGLDLTSGETGSILPLLAFTIESAG